jgi:hypothetical protein
MDDTDASAAAEEIRRVIRRELDDCERAINAKANMKKQRANWTMRFEN